MEGEIREELLQVEEPRIETPRIDTPRVETPPMDPRELLAGAGLQMVETDATKARPTAPEPEPVKLGRPRRERPVLQPASEELVQVETRNK